MPTFFYWGDDEFSLNRAVQEVRDRTLEAGWESFNYDKISPDHPNALVQALNQAMTPPFGMGQRLVWLANTTLGQSCAENELNELQRTLPALPDATVLLLTSVQKPDGRLKSTKFLQKHAEIREFASISPWKTDLLIKQVQQAAKMLDVAVSPTAAELLADAVGNDTRQLYTELEKLKLYSEGSHQPIDEEAIARLVTTSTQNSLKLAVAIRSGNTGAALTLVRDLFNHNEPALKIVATLIGQFRMWLWVKLMVAERERDDRAIAKAAEIANPKRIYFLKKEVQHLSLDVFQTSLFILRDLEAGLKLGADATMLMQTKVIELCQLFRK
ncbi:MAG: DNA polymerase III subunit delta [Cyanobacteria bacterium P01_E01_bin.6]